MRKAPLCYLITVVLAVICVRTTDTFTALFLLLEHVKGCAEHDEHHRGDYNNIYHALFLAFKVIRIQMTANAATAAPPRIAGTTASDDGATISVPTV